MEQKSKKAIVIDTEFTKLNTLDQSELLLLLKPIAQRFKLLLLNLGSNEFGEDSENIYTENYLAENSDNSDTNPSTIRTQEEKTEIVNKFAKKINCTVSEILYFGESLKNAGIESLTVQNTDQAIEMLKLISS